MIRVSEHLAGFFLSPAVFCVCEREGKKNLYACEHLGICKYTCVCMYVSV